jgi:hypothetical protein
VLLLELQFGRVLDGDDAFASEMKLESTLRARLARAGR